MARRGRLFAKLFLFVFLVTVVGVLGINLFRLTFHTPQPVRGSVTRVRNAFVDFYAAKNGARVLFFDAGTDPLGRGADAALKALGASRDEVTDVFLTHGHGDHLGAASLFRNARVHGGARDAALVDGSEVPLKLKLMGLLQPGNAVKVTDPLDGKASIDVGAGQAVKAIPLPGHTPGSYLYLWDKVLFVGDSMNWNEKTQALEPPPEFFSSDPAELRQSLAGLQKTLAGVDFERICTGHGGCTPPGEAKKRLDELIAKMQ
jgi:glyoxylase-like metal-dependent hydrolase (beta-lactamase superfamily II)